jgi:hypothetical protein
VWWLASVVTTAIRWLPLAVTLGLLGGTLAHAQSSNIINACYNTRTGAMRLVGTETTCREPEALISWPADDLRGRVEDLEADVNALRARVDALQARLDALTTNTVFVTSAIYNGDLGGLAGADATCQALADAAGLTGTYKAWLSDTTASPSTRFTQSANPYVRVDGVIVADNWADLTDGTLDATISRDEHGALTAWTSVWTSTTPLGTIYPSNGNYTCNEWRGTSFYAGGTGSTLHTDGYWTAVLVNGIPDCNLRNALYCVEQ